MTFNDDGDNKTYRLSTQTIDTSGFNNLELEFKHYLDYAGYYQGFTIKVQISTDGGTTWSDSNWIIIDPNSDIGPETVSIDLSSYVGENIKIAWVFDGYPFDIWDWYIDDIKLTGN